MAGPLNGVRVVDLTSIYSGPICTSILGDHGADVIKVEPPGGDPMRFPGRNAVNDVNGPFAMLNRNKRAIVLDLQNDAGKQVLRAMLEKSDVVVDNFRPGVMDRLGFDWKYLERLNPRLISASITGVGDEGPYSNRRVYDAVIQAISGLASLQEPSDGERPQMINTLLCDKITAMTAAQNICSALYSRSVTGKGQRVQVSMLDSSLFFLWPDSMASFTFVGRERQGPFYPSHAGFVRKTKDGYIATMPVKAGEWQGLFAALNLDDLLLEDPRFNTPLARQENRQLFQTMLNAAYENFTTAELAKRLEENEVPFATINSRPDVIEDPQIQAMDALLEFDHPHGGRMRQPRPTGQFSNTPPSIFRCSPGLGEHTEEVLFELGYTKDQVAEFRLGGVIQ